MPHSYEKPGSDIKKTGWLKKLKTNKKKFFVLRSTSSSGPARIEYHDNEKRFKAGLPPKKSIQLHTCFNINKKSDTRIKNAVAIYLEDGSCFAVVADNVVEQDSWLSLLLEYQNEFYTADGENQPGQHFDYIWQINVMKQKGLGSTIKGLPGQYKLCLSTTSAILVFVKNNTSRPEYSFQLSNIRRCGYSDGFFFMEVGRNSPTGAGEIYVSVDEGAIAQNINDVVLQTMRTCNTEFQRPRSNTSASNRRSHDPYRNRGDSESRTQVSPKKRPMSAASPHIRSSSYSEDGSIQTSLAPFSSTLETPPIPEGPVNQLIHDYRSRSDSAGSCRSTNSFTNIPAGDIFSTSPSAEVMSVPLRPKSPESNHSSVIEENNYLAMSPGQQTTPPASKHMTLERPGSAGSDRVEGRPEKDGYVPMKPTSFSADNGYMEMSVHSNQEQQHPQQHPHPQPTIQAPDNSYMLMGNRSMSSAVPIPMRGPKEPGYMEMGPSSQPLPTVKEGGSGEAYLPMDITGLSPKSALELKPAKVFSYLSDDSTSGEPPKRAYSVGSRPMKQIHRTMLHPEPVNVQDNNRSSSAPHLIPMTMGMKHVSPYMSMDGSSTSCNSSVIAPSDTDSLMELEFMRPRTASESIGYRQRTSSMGKTYPSQSHRPRSSSYGHMSRGGKTGPVDPRLKQLTKTLGSFESVRMTSKELKHKRSLESLGQFSNASSTESLRRLDSISKSSQQSDYVDMSISKKDDPNSYVDMTVGKPPVKGNHSRSSSMHSLASSSSVSAVSSNDIKSPIDGKVVMSSGHTVQKPQGLVPASGETLISQSSLFSPISFTSASGSRSSSIKGKSPVSSGRESEEEGYVPFHPGGSGSKGSKDKKETLGDSRFSAKKKKGKETKKGRSSPKDGKQSPKEEVKSPPVVTDEVYMDYEPGSVSVIPNQPTNMGYGLASTSIGSMPYEQNFSDLSIQPHVVKSRTQEQELNDNSYLDYQPGMVESSIKPLKPMGVASYISAGDEPPGKESAAKPSPETHKMDSSLASSVNPASDYIQYDAADAAELMANVAAIEPPVKEMPQSQPIKREETSASGYMDFDPASETINVAATPMAPPPQKSYIIGETTTQTKDNNIFQVENKDKLSMAAIKCKREPLTSKPSLPEIPEGLLRKDNSSKDFQNQNGTPVVEVKTFTQVSVDVDDEDDGYTALNYGENRPHFLVGEDEQVDGQRESPRPQQVRSEILVDDACEMKLEPVKSAIIVDDSDPGPQKACKKSTGGSGKSGFKRMFSSGEKSEKKDQKKEESGGKEKTSRKISVPLMGSLNAAGAAILSQFSSKSSGNAQMSSGRKGSVTSLSSDNGKKDDASALGNSSESLDRKLRGDNCDKLSPCHDMQKQMSMPCINPVLQAQEIPNPTSPVSPHDGHKSSKSRHSCSDLVVSYEEMSLHGGKAPLESPSQALCQQSWGSSTSPSSTNQSGVSACQLNYASLDLGSAEDVSDLRSPRSVKSRHSSSADEMTSCPPLSYAEIDFKKSESLKKSLNNVSTPFE